MPGDIGESTSLPRSNPFPSGRPVPPLGQNPAGEVADDRKTIMGGKQKPDGSNSQFQAISKNPVEKVGQVKEKIASELKIGIGPPDQKRFTATTTTTTIDKGITAKSPPPPRVEPILRKQEPPSKTLSEVQAAIDSSTPRARKDTVSAEPIGTKPLTDSVIDQAMKNLEGLYRFGGQGILLFSKNLYDEKLLEIENLIKEIKDKKEEYGKSKEKLISVIQEYEKNIESIRTSFVELRSAMNNANAEYKGLKSKKDTQIKSIEKKLKDEENKFNNVIINSEMKDDVIFKGRCNDIVSVISQFYNNIKLYSIPMTFLESFTSNNYLSMLRNLQSIQDNLKLIENQIKKDYDQEENKYKEESRRKGITNLQQSRGVTNAVDPTSSSTKRKTEFPNLDP